MSLDICDYVKMLFPSFSLPELCTLLQALLLPIMVPLKVFRVNREYKQGLIVVKKWFQFGTYILAFGWQLGTPNYASIYFSIIWLNEHFLTLFKKKLLANLAFSANFIYIFCCQKRDFACFWWILPFHCSWLKSRASRSVVNFHRVVPSPC